MADDETDTAAHLPNISSYNLSLQINTKNYDNCPTVTKTMLTQAMKYQSCICLTVCRKLLCRIYEYGGVVGSSSCTREIFAYQWKTDFCTPLQSKACRKNRAAVKYHFHSSTFDLGMQTNLQEYYYEVRLPFSSINISCPNWTYLISKRWVFIAQSNITQMPQ